MKKAFAIILSLCLLLTTAPCVQGAESEAEFEGYLVKVKAGEPVSLFAFEAESQQAEGRLYVVDTPAEAVYYAAPSEIEYIEPNYIITAFEGEASQYLPAQWELSAVKAQAAWNSVLYGEGVKVAVIDSGLRTTHEDLAGGTILPVVDFTNDGQNVLDATGHGTVVGGMIAAQVNNAQTEGTPAVDGVASGATILPLRIFSKIKSATLDMAINAIGYAVAQECDVINMSFGIDSSGNPSRALLEACQAAADDGILLVAAAGNWYTTNYSFPASYDCVVSVASVGMGQGEGEYVHASFSQRNDGVFISAPGVGITGLSYTGDQAYVTGKEGTSFSAPMVSGMAALAKEQNPAVTTESFEKLLIASCTDLGETGKDNLYGYGLIDMERYVNELTRDYTVTFVNEEGLADWPADASYRLDMLSDFTLPVPVRENYTFLGWYTDSGKTGKAIDTISSGSVGDVTLYADWESNDEAEVKGILAAGYPAVKSEEKEDTFLVTLPKGKTLEAEAIQISLLTEGASVRNLIQTDSGWSFTVTSQSGKTQKDYTLLVTQSDNSAPERIGETPVAGTAVPASLDGKTEAVPCQINVAQYFQDPDGDPLEYDILHPQGETMNVNRQTGEVSYTPRQEDAGSTVTIQICATDGNFTSDPLPVAIAVSPLPDSQSTINPTKATYDRSKPADLEIELELYRNTLVSISVKADASNAEAKTLTAETDYILHSSLTGKSDAVQLLAESLKNLDLGNYKVILEFDAGEPQELALTVLDSSLLTVTFLADGNKVYSIRENVQKNDTVKLPEEPSKTGYTFGGWFTGSDGTGTEFTAQTPVTSKLTLYAKWISSGGSSGGGGGSSGGGGGGGSSIPTFTVTATAGAGGSVSPETASVKAGEDITITVKPEEGFAISEILVDGTRIELPKDIYSAFEYIFTKVTQPHTFDVNFIKQDQIVEELVSYPDVKEQDWFFSAVQFVSKEGLFSGMGDGRFCPDDSMTRSMLMSVLYRMAGEPETSLENKLFSDVPANEWYTKAVLWGASNGVISGYGDGQFGPDDSVTRESIVTILWRYAGSPHADVSLDSFEDANQISGYAQEAIRWAVNTGLLVGDGNTINPGGFASRAEVAAILMRYQNIL